MAVKWSDSKVGYDPGQKQSITINFLSRDESNVRVSYKFSATSLGKDDYTYNQRRNVVTITVGGTSKSFKYQLHGNKASTSKEGTFTVADVGNGVTALAVTYENNRVGTNTPYYGPKSTGAHKKSQIGTLQISDNVKYSVSYNKANPNTVSNIPSSQTYYKGTVFNIPNNILNDITGHYIFNTGYSASSTGSVNIKTPEIRLSSAQRVVGNATYYATWQRRTYIYRFFKDSSLSSKFKPDIEKKYVYGLAPATLSNLNELTKDNSEVNDYYKEGYSFKGWNSNRGSILVDNLNCNYDADVNFYPGWEAITSKINFNYGFDNYIRSIDYTYDTQLKFNVSLLNKEGEAKSNILLRPGYKLIGWSYSPHEVYNPLQAPTPDYSVDAFEKVKYKQNFTNREFIDSGITLYAVWEYYTTLYVYTEGNWKLAVPYVYIDNKWDIALAKCYTDNSWKL